MPSELGIASSLREHLTGQSKHCVPSELGIASSLREHRRRLALVAVLVAVGQGSASAAAAARCPAGPSFDPAVPTWQAVNGFALGSRPASVDEINAYVHAVDHVTDRVVSGSAGLSVQGRPLTYTVVAEPSMLRSGRLRALTGRMRAVRAGRRAALSSGDPVIVWLAGAVHGNEPSGSDADMRVLYELAARTDCAALARLHAVLTVILPVQNPDGHAAGTRVNAAGFDLNRDWFAATQPETVGKLQLLARMMPVVFADQHEEPGTGFFFPPNDDPVHHEISAQALRAIALAGRGLARAFAAHGVLFATRKDYDLFFMGYGDTVTTTLFGAAGMTFEKGSDSPYGDRVWQHWLAADTVLTVAARSRTTLLQGWAAQWRQAREQGRAGRLQPNPVGDGRFAVPRAPVYGYAVRADRHAADAAALVARLRATGVRVRALRRALRVPAFDPYGAQTTARAALASGTYVISAAQAAKHWVEAMLGEDAYVSVPRSYDASSWSNPLLMGLEGGTLRRPVPRRALRPVGAPATLLAGDGDLAFEGDSERALELACALLARGVAVARVPAQGTLVVPRTADTALLGHMASAHGVVVRRVSRTVTGAVPLRVPHVALLADGPNTAQQAASSSFTRWLVGHRLGLPVDVLGDAQLAGGALAGGGYTALIVPDGEPTTLSLPAQLALQSWVRSGGTYIGYRARGIGIAQEAGLTAARTQLRPPDLQVPGATLALALDPARPVAWGMGTAAFAFDDNDPPVNAGSDDVHTVARYPAGDKFFASGFADGTQALHGMPALLDVPAGAGRAILFSFDPVFRGYVEGTERLLVNALLAP